MKRNVFLTAALLALMGLLFAACDTGSTGGPRPEIAIDTQPVAMTTVTEGSITGSLSVEASVTQGARLSYQWFSNTSASNTDGSELYGMNEASFTIPTNLTEGTHFFFVEVQASGGATPVRSTVAEVTVSAPGIPVITITTQPALETIVMVGNISGSLTVAANVTGSEIASYQWFSNATNSNTNGYTIETGATATDASFAIPTDLGVGARYFFAEVTAPGAVAVRSYVARVYVSALTALTPLAPPASVTLNQSGEIAFTSGANNPAGTTFTFTLFRGGTAVADFVDEPIASGGATVIALVNTMLNEAGAYTVRVTARTSTAGFTPTSSAFASNAVNVFAVNVTIDGGNGTDMVSIGGQPHTASFTTHAFSGSTVTLEATPAGSRLVTWSGAGDTVGNTRSITGISENVAVTAAFTDPAAITLEMVPVEGGSFERGRELGTAFSGDTTPVYTITISAFYLGRYQVTREQWTTVMTGNPNGISATNPSWSTAAANAQETAAGFYMNRRPVTHVSWYDAIVFSNRLSIQRGLTPAYELPNVWPNPTGWSHDPDTWGSVPTSWDVRWNNVRIVPGSSGYRLPTEAQWEFAAKGGNPQQPFTFAGSNTATAVGWILDNSGGSPRMVGLLPANGLGLRDMTGNVWEWVWDWWGTYTATPSTDPVGASSGSNRVIRGGGWSNGFADGVRSVSRSVDNPDVRWGGLNGFRVSRP